MTSGLFHIDREHLDVRLATWAVVAILVAGVLEVVIGQGGLQAVVAALLVSAVGRSSGPATMVTTMVAVTLVGGSIGLLAYVSAESAWLAALFLALVCYLTGLAYAYGPMIGRVGYLLLLWAMAILIGEAHGGDPFTTAVAFFVGGAVAIGVALVRERVGGEPLRSDAEAGGGEPVAAHPSLIDVARSDLGIWSLVRAGLTIVAVTLGYQLLANDLDPFWVAIPLLVVLVPDRDQALFKAAQRGIGTFLGVASTLALLTLFGTEPAIIVVTLIATFGTVAFYHANYAIYAFFLTNTVLLYYWLATGHDLDGPGQRLIATVLGLGLAIVGVAVMEGLRRWRLPRTAAR